MTSTSARSTAATSLDSQCSDSATAMPARIAMASRDLGLRLSVDGCRYDCRRDEPLARYAGHHDHFLRTIELAGRLT